MRAASRSISAWRSTFPAPNSFTGEDVLELHGHGGTVLVEALLEHLVQLGARRARPGEFSERAYLNDKLDLAQAEAMADLIDAGSRGRGTRRAALAAGRVQCTRRMRCASGWSRCACRWRRASTSPTSTWTSRRFRACV